jgi:hypothetical protein
MKIGRLVLFIITPALLFLPAAAAAAGLFVEGGEGFYRSHNTEAVLLRYQIKASKLFDRESFYEASYAYWNGSNHDTAFSIARGIRWWERTGHEALSLTAGLGHIDRTTSNLGQPFEFYGRLAYDKPLGMALLSVGLIHYSDAKFLFRWPGPNNGENFLTLSLGMIF